MITPWMIYLIGILDSLGKFFAVLGTIIIAVRAIKGFCAFLLKEETGSIGSDGPSKSYCMYAIGIALIGISVLLPSTKLAAAMYIVPVVANNRDIQSIGGNSMEALRKLTEKWLIELSKNGHSSKSAKSGEGLPYDATI